VIGAGPAGLMAAQELAKAGRKVVLVEAKPSPARKFLMAGKSGLNLTRDEDFEGFLGNYGQDANHLRDMISAFDNKAVQAWARDLGQPVFTGSTGRVFPKAMKAPLLRAWLGELFEQGVELRTRWQWLGWQDQAFRFATPDGEQSLTPKVTVLALGGASWARLGSNGKWAPWLADQGIEMTPFSPCNVGVRVDWSSHMTRHFGAPLKGIRLTAGGHSSRGEMVVTASGLEGGGIYTVSAGVRDGQALAIDLLPDWSPERVAQVLARRRGKSTLNNHLRKSLHLGPAKIALLMEFGRPLPGGTDLARLIKSLPIKTTGLGPIDGAISTGGGVAWSALNSDLMLTELPGVFAAGEMLDWQAPTGGYLLTACLATGKWAGKHAAQWR